MQIQIQITIVLVHFAGFLSLFMTYCPLPYGTNKRHAIYATSSPFFETFGLDTFMALSDMHPVTT